MSDEWYTPRWLLYEIGIIFDMDPCPAQGSGGLEKEWAGSVWVNPPFSGKRGLMPWAEKFFEHGNGVLLTPDNTSTKWWQYCANNADVILFIDRRIKFVKPDGSEGKDPRNGTTLFGIGECAQALARCKVKGFRS